MTSITTTVLVAAVLGSPFFAQAPSRSEAPRADAAVVDPGAQEREPAPARQPAAAPQARTPQPPQPGQSPQADLAIPPPPPPAPPAPQERRPLPTRNVKVDVTITEQTGTGTPVKKVVSTIVADGRSSGVRSISYVPLFDGGGRDLPLNVDASATVTPDQRVLLDLRFYYSTMIAMTPFGSEGRPAPESDAERARNRDMSAPKPGVSQITENLSVLLTPGRPMMVARSADAAADRTVTVDVTVDILK